jgi:hypothetical protein
MNMELQGYTYRRYPDGKGKQVHVVECWIDGRQCRFEADSKERVDTLALMAFNTARYQAERAEEHRQMRLEEQRKVLDFTDARGGDETGYDS